MKWDAIAVPSHKKQRRVISDVHLGVVATLDQGVRAIQNLGAKFSGPGERLLINPHAKPVHGFVQWVHQNHTPAAEEPGQEFRKAAAPRAAGFITLAQVLEQSHTRLTRRQRRFQLVERGSDFRRVPHLAHRRKGRRAITRIA